ncbi:ATP-binding protein [Dongshaea marina]|uniref:ATP-binding protein n=1 Tax=Dongshaea marina TaxID=2047966 RepID=UPI0038995979
MHPRGEICLQLDVKQQILSFAVKDPGIGIAREDQQRIFQPFHQTRHQQSGSGLGLPISLKLAELMGEA